MTANVQHPMATDAIVLKVEQMFLPNLLYHLPEKAEPSATLPHKGHHKAPGTELKLTLKRVATCQRPESSKAATMTAAMYTALPSYGRLAKGGQAFISARYPTSSLLCVI